MTWREALIARILLIIGRMVADDPAIKQALLSLSNHIAANHEKERPLPEVPFV